MGYQAYRERLDHALEKLRSKYMGQEVRFPALLPGRVCLDQNRYAHRVAQVLMLQAARVLPEQGEDICRGYRWLHAAALYLIYTCPPEDHTVCSVIRLARLDRTIRNQLDFAHFPKRYVGAFLDAPPYIAAGLEVAAWRMAEPSEEQLKKLEDLCGKL